MIFPYDPHAFFFSFLPVSFPIENHRDQLIQALTNNSKSFKSPEEAEAYTRRIATEPAEFSFAIILLPTSDSGDSTTTAATMTTTTAAGSNSSSSSSSNNSFIGFMRASTDEDYLSYSLAPSHWNQGFASEALAAFLPAYFARFPSKTRMYANIEPHNVASARVLEKLGFQLDKANVRRRLTFSVVERDESEVKEVRNAVEALGLQPSVNPPPSESMRSYTEYVYHKGMWPWTMAEE
jgi:RimJ/RimL family protein N-acetyltransferase